MAYRIEWYLGNRARIKGKQMIEILFAFQLQLTSLLALIAALLR